MVRKTSSSRNAWVANQRRSSNIDNDDGPIQPRDYSGADQSADTEAAVERWLTSPATRSNSKRLSISSLRISSAEDQKGKSLLRDRFRARSFKARQSLSGGEVRQLAHRGGGGGGSGSGSNPRNAMSKSSSRPIALTSGRRSRSLQHVRTSAIQSANTFDILSCLSKPEGILASEGVLSPERRSHVTTSSAPAATPSYYPMTRGSSTGSQGDLARRRRSKVTLKIETSNASEEDSNANSVVLSSPRKTKPGKSSTSATTPDGTKRGTSQRNVVSPNTGTSSTTIASPSRNGTSFLNLRSGGGLGGTAELTRRTRSLPRNIKKEQTLREAKSFSPHKNATKVNNPETRDNQDSSNIIRQVRHDRRQTPISPKRTNRVKLHIYDLIAQETVVQLPWGCHFPIGQCFSVVNQSLHTLGTGAYHVGIEMNGVEYAYGANDTPGCTGVFTCMPKHSPGYQYRTTIDFGDRVLIRKEIVRCNYSSLRPNEWNYTSADFREIERYVDGKEVLREMAREYMGADYDLLRKNCCTFAQDACLRLGVGANEIPSWFRNLAHAGAMTHDAAISTMQPISKVFSSCDCDNGMPEYVSENGFEVIRTKAQSTKEKVDVVKAAQSPDGEDGDKQDRDNNAEVLKTLSWRY